MTYKQGLVSGLVLSVLIAIISPLTQWVTTYIITPKYFPNVIKRSVELGYYSTIEDAKAQFNYKNYAISGMVFSFIMGVFTTAIAMNFLKSKVRK